MKIAALLALVGRRWGREVISPFLKPAKRGPKPKRPIRRSSTPIDRGSRPSRVRRTPRGQTIEILKGLFSRVVKLRDPLCKIQHEGCTGLTNDAAHLYCVSTFPRLRFDLRVAVGACRPCHTYIDTHPLIRTFVLNVLIPAVDQQQLAFANACSPDLAEVRRTLTAQLRRIAA